ncbi:MAG: flagellar M-ring protein FliF [Gammaproteobacteria bacterium HGW-Gammaproteobacteria-3]|nr:MAG: flagellar M-ring protein FliF [Gammaproteobacteria bacterium HGW-Gammaproteobacteria-3]
MSEQDVNEQTATLPAQTRTDTAIHPLMKGLSDLTMARQIGLMLGFAFSVAVAVAMVLWSQEASYSLLFSGIAEQDAAEIIEVLDKQGVEYKVETSSGAIMVPGAAVRELKLKLAAQGLPRSNSLGYELLDKEQSFGTSKDDEQMRFRRALEGEIARTIMTLQSVKAARVILALPRQSVFIRKQKKPSASVAVNLYQGRTLEKEQIQSIIHLVASSVPLMEAGQVTVVDQQGRLLNSTASDPGAMMTSTQFEYKKNIEEHLMNRIENILSPLVGGDGLRTQVSADVDFTVTERTQEKFDPEQSVLRSEQTREEQNSMAAVQGVPGALSNQPPPAGVAPEIAVGEKTGNTTTSGSKSATRNFELDKTITHTRMATGVLKRLSVAVVVDNRARIGEDGAMSSEPYSQEDINRFSDLVKQAVGFDDSRGDQVTVTNVAFMAPEAIEALPEPSLFEQAWFIDMMKQVAAVMVILFLVFGVLRPTMRGLVGRSEAELKAEALEKARAEAEAMGGTVAFDEKGIPYAVAANENTQTAPGLSSDTEDLLLLEAPQNYEKRLEYVQKLVDEDPQLVAQVIKMWVKQDG